jgi:hypothetical protein
MEAGAWPKTRVAERARRQVRARRVRKRLGSTIQEGFRRKIVKE